VKYSCTAGDKGHWVRRPRRLKVVFDKLSACGKEGANGVTGRRVSKRGAVCRTGVRGRGGFTDFLRGTKIRLQFGPPTIFQRTAEDKQHPGLEGPRRTSFCSARNGCGTAARRGSTSPPQMIEETGCQKRGGLACAPRARSCRERRRGRSKGPERCERGSGQPRNRLA